MAYVVKDARGRSPYWYAIYRDAIGKRIRKSTGLTAKSKALEFARTLQRASDEARRGSLTEARARELVSEILVATTGETLRFFTVRQWFDHFVKEKRKTQSDKTARRYEQVRDLFLECLDKRADLNVAAITSKDIADFRDYRQSLGLSPATVNLDVTVLSAVFSAAHKQGHIPVNPCASIKPVKDRSAQRKHVFTPEQVRVLVKTAKGDWRGLILVAFYSGMRLGDAANLKWSSIDLIGDIKTIRYRPQKGGGEVVVVVHPALEDYLLSLPAPKRTDHDAFVFPSLGGRNISPLSKFFRKLMADARIQQHVIRGRSGGGRSVNALSFHSLRHSFSSLLANAGVPEERRMALTGHVTRDVHQQYTHHQLQALRDAVAVLPRI